MPTAEPRQIRLVEVGPRDGLQNESAPIATSIKVAFVDALSLAGLDEVEVSAFVSARWVPQLGDAEAVFAGIRRHPCVTYSALVPNLQGLARAQAACVDKVSVLTAASDTFNRKNVNTDIDGTFARLAPVVEAAKAAHLKTRGYVSMAFWCPYEGAVLPTRVRDVVTRLEAAGVDEVSLGDTIGKATPDEVEALFEVLLARFSPHFLALHAHDTYGRAASNVARAYQLGLSTFDASAGGLGGCPYAPGAPGNIATQTVIDTLQALGAVVGGDKAALNAAHAVVAPYLGPRAPKDW